MPTKTLNALENLAALATSTVEDWNLAGKTIVEAVRDGARRAVQATTERSAIATAEDQPSVLSDQMRSQWRASRSEWSELLVQRAEADASNIMLVMDRAAVAATSNIDSTVSYLQMLAMPAGSGMIDAMVAMQLPLAQFRAQIARSALQGAQQFAAQLAQQGEMVQQAARPVTKAAASAGKTA